MVQIVSVTKKETPKRILVVDDNPVNRLVLKGFLDLLSDSEICFAVDGVHAVEQFSKNGADFIFMDVSMPRLDGIGATKAIREYEIENDLPHTPIIAVTALAGEDDRDRCMNAGMDDHLPKPVNIDIIGEALSQHANQNH